MQWIWLPYDQLTAKQIYDVLRARQQVFVIEQNCVYLDADRVDQDCWHLMAYTEETETEKSELLAYCRVVNAGIKYQEYSIGRVLTTELARGKGFGKTMMQTALDKIDNQFEHASVRISAQRYLEKFYRDFGFKTVSAPYDEDGILHVEMLRLAK